MKIRTVVLWSALLIALDQITKLIIHEYYMDSHFTLIPHLLEFKPVFNSQYSYINVLLNRHLNINMGLALHLVIYLISLTMVLLLYFFFRHCHKETKLLDWAMIFMLAGMAGALVGNVVWKEGVLDFIYLKPLFVFDLKDLYTNCFVILFLLWSSKYSKFIKEKKITEYYKSLFQNR